MGRIGRTLAQYREALAWYLLIGTSVTVMLTGPQPTGFLPNPPPSLPVERTVGEPPPATLPPPPTVTTPATATTRPPQPTATTSRAGETVPETRGAEPQPQAAPPGVPPPPTVAPPTTVVTTTTPPPAPTTTTPPRNKATGLPGADGITICYFTVDGGTKIQRPCPPDH